MKKISLALALLLIFSLLASCNEGDTPPEVTTTAATTTATTTTVVTTTVATTTGRNINTTSALDNIELKAEMDAAEIRSLIKDDPAVIHLPHYNIFTNSNMESVVIKYDANYTKIQRVEKYPMVSERDFSLVKDGMSIFEVVEALGAPDKLAEKTSIYTLAYHVNEIDYIGILLMNSDNFTDLRVWVPKS
ncbi:MAG: hypothetical protein E7641_00375 [Ruminococcaceae bacterium]|nr:hypothetical protein [Oscillospiraceae bacterium]